MNQVYEKVVKCYESIKDRIPLTPKVALVLGSGLGNYADTMDLKAEIDYSEIKDFHIHGSGTCRKVYLRLCKGRTCGVHERESALLRGVSDFGCGASRPSYENDGR